MRLSVQKIGPALCAFSPEQKQLIKSRLWLYRASQGANVQSTSWGRIALEIGTLPSAGDLDAATVQHLLERYRYYLLTQPRRGREKPSAELVSEAAFAVSEDTLARWFAGLGRGDQLEGRKLYEPSAQIIAGIRDFLLLKGYLCETELVAKDPPLAPAFALNALASVQMRSPLPVEFASTYLAYGRCGEELSARMLVFAEEPDAGIIRVQETHFNSVTGAPGDTKNLSRVPSDKRKVRFGWIALGLSPALLLIFPPDGMGKGQVGIAQLNVASLRGEQVAVISYINAASFTQTDEGVFPVSGQDSAFFLVDPTRNNFRELIDKNMYNSKRVSGHYFQGDANAIINSMVQDIEQKNSGKELYDRVVQMYGALYEVDARKTDLIFDGTPARMIREGADVNYFCPENGSSIIHYITLMGAWDMLEALDERDDVDYLVRTVDGRLPSDFAAMHFEPELLEYITRKQVEQAQRQGISFADILSPGR